MCGILGIYNLNRAPIALSTLKMMSDKISHRGPDGEGFFLKDHIKDNKGVSFHKVYSSNNPLTLYTIFKREERTL